MTSRPGLLVALRWLMLAVFLGGLIIGWILGSPVGREQLFVLSVAAYAAVGWVVTNQRRENPVGWLFMLVACMTGLGALADGMTQRALDMGDPALWYGRWGGWLAGWFWYPLFASATLFTLLLFPDGLASRRWRPVLWISIAATTLLTMGVMVQTRVAVGSTFPPQPDGTCPPGMTAELDVCGHWVDSPLGLPSHLNDPSSGQTVAVILVSTLGLCLVLAVVGVVLRFRSSQGDSRLQMRWFVSGAIAVLAWLTFASLFMRDESPIWSEVALAVATALIPVSCGIAITRYHLYDIDRIISRTTSYAIVTATVIAVYAIVVTTVTRLLPDSNQVAVAGATLTAAALARPLLRRVQELVDQRFNRSRFEANETVGAFGTRLQGTVEPHLVGDDLVTVVSRTLQPSEVTLWVRGDAG